MPIHGEMVETRGACTRSTNSRCTVMFLVDLRVDEASTTTDWQVYGPRWEVRRELNVRVRFVMLPSLTGRPTEMPPMLVTSVPLECIHCTTGWMLTSTVQVRVRVFPATALPGPEMVTVCEGSGEVGGSKVSHHENPTRQYQQSLTYYHDAQHTGGVSTCSNKGRRHIRAGNSTTSVDTRVTCL